MSIRHVVCLTFAATMILGVGLRSATAVDMFSEEKGFMQDVAYANNYETEAANHALAHSANPRVKEYAQMILDEHKQLGQEMQKLARRVDVDLPREPSWVQQAKLSLLKDKEELEFDVEYAQKLGVTAHEETIKRFQEYMERGKEREVLEFAKNTLPILQQHFQQATALYQSLQSPDS